jgi:hypothetical protein
MKTVQSCAPLFPIVLLAILGCPAPAAHAQDNVRGGTEPVVDSIDPSKLPYDYLVDGDLPQDDPANRQFKTLQAAYAAAPEGTEKKPTVIGIRPNVYQLPGPARGFSMNITKNYITLLGLTNNRRSVVLADNRGLMQGSDDNGYIINVDANGFTARNLTILNYCNADYEYPGDAKKNLAKRSNVITQAVALQATGDRHVYENVALLGRLDTMFLRTSRSYFKNVYIEGTDDWMGGGQISVWQDCTLVYPEGSGVMSASNVVFLNCRFEATEGMQLYKAEFRGAERPDVLINCVLPVSSPQAPVAWVRGKAPARPSVYTLTSHSTDAKGNPAVVYDCNVGEPAYTYSRELSERELAAFNPWNLLRAASNGAVDDWDPAGVREKYDAAKQGNLVYRMALNGSGSTIRTDGPGATLSASVTPARAAAESTITWSTKSDLISLDKTSGSKVTVTGRNATDKAQWAAINASAPDGFYVTAHVLVEPKYIDPPAITAAPKLNPPSHGTVSVDYRLDLGGREDQSLVSWSFCDDPGGSNAREIAVSRGNQPLKTLVLMPGFAGKYLKVGVQPKFQISEPGPAVYAVSVAPAAASDIPSPNVSVDFRSLVATPNDSYGSGLWTILGGWTVAAGEDLVNGYGLRSGRESTSLLYQQDAPSDDMQVDLVMSPDKTAGQGFSVPGSPAETGPRNLHSDVYIKYDPRTRNGYSLRFWRTTQSANKCMFQIYRIVDGVGSPIDDKQVLSGVFKPNTTMTLKVVGTTLTVDASNDDDKEVLHLEGTIAPNRFGGAGVFWPGGSANVYSRLEITYPGTAPAPAKP